MLIAIRMPNTPPTITNIPPTTWWQVPSIPRTASWQVPNTLPTTRWQVAGEYNLLFILELRRLSDTTSGCRRLAQSPLYVKKSANSIISCT